MLNDPASLSTAGAWSLNVISSVGIILVNKAVMQSYGFKYATTLTAMHFAVTSFAGILAKRLGLLSAESRVPFWSIFAFSFLADTSVVSLNLSLMTNSVGFYQIAKLSIIPACCLFEYLLNAKRFSRRVIFTVFVVMVGVGICTVTDVQVRPLGLFFAILSVLSTTLLQILIGSLQKAYSIGSFDLLSQTAPIQAVTLLLCGPIIDRFISGSDVFHFGFSLGSVFLILLSCILALFVNISMYLCIGKFSAVSFQVLGHMKTICVLTLGWLLFDSAITLKLAGGMAVAILGMVLYSAAVEREKKTAGGPLLGDSAGKSGAGAEKAVGGVLLDNSTSVGTLKKVSSSNSLLDSKEKEKEGESDPLLEKMEEGKREDDGTEIPKSPKVLKRVGWGRKDGEAPKTH